MDDGAPLDRGKGRWGRLAAPAPPIVVVYLPKYGYWTEEAWVDAGGAPPPGYWRRQEERAIRAGSLRGIIRRARGRLVRSVRGGG